MIGIWIGALLVSLKGPWLRDLPLHEALHIAPLLAYAATLQAWIGSLLLNRLMGRSWQRTKSMSDASKFLLLGALLSSAVGAGLSLASLHIYGRLPQEGAWFTLWNFFLGDALGVLLFALPTLRLLAATQQGQSSPAIRSLVLPLLGYALCIAVLTGVEKLERLEEARQFTASNTLILEQINKRLAAQRGTLAALGQQIGKKPSFTTEEFERFTANTLQGNPDIVSLSYQRLVSREQRADFERQLAQRTKQKASVITEPNTQNQLVRAEDRASYLVLQDMVPAARKRSMLGLDSASDPVRRAAIELAIKSREMSATPAITRVHEQRGQRGMLQFFPIVNATDNGKSEPVTGFVVAAINIDETIRLATRELAIPGLEVSLVNIQAPADRTKLTRKQREKSSFMVSPLPPSQTSTIEIGKAAWLLSIDARPDYILLHQHKRWYYSAAALLLALISDLAWTYLGTRQRLLQWHFRGQAKLAPAALDAT